MNFFDEQTATDLEFDVIRKLLVSFCQSETASFWSDHLRPFHSLKKATEALEQTSNLQLIKSRGLTFPRIEFKELKKEIQLLNINSGVLSLESVVKIWDASKLTNELLLFFKQNKEEYISLQNLLRNITYTKDIDQAISKILDKRFEVKDDASVALLDIRTQIKTVKNRINKNFDRALRSAQKLGFSSDIQENSIDNRRVLSITSTYKRQVEGRILGASKTGSLTYIEPKINERLNNELDQLIDDERKEVQKILTELSNFLRTYINLIEAYQKVLCQFDFINAKVRLANKMNATKPQINTQDQETVLDKAFHPILLLNNSSLKKETIPQSFKLSNQSRILVISGPNAGGKSITLKTAGLLQLMFQSGLLISASSNSKMGWFDYILSDIGDNQSIENQLSTYSYRLQRMNFFLSKVNTKTLLLLDEFGTGSDPELGGALAEVFFETIYDKGCYGVITTHYTNIKLKAAELKEAINANMLFEKETLQPKYELSVGQAGSSFTFEVAEMNGIPNELIRIAKTKIDKNKLKLDYLIADLQKEKSLLYEQNKVVQQDRREMNEARVGFENKQSRYEERMKVQQIRIERNDKCLRHGKKLFETISAYDVRNKKKQRELLEGLTKYVILENAKIIEQRRRKKEKEALKEVKKPQKVKTKKAIQAIQGLIEVGSKVRLKNSSQKGEVIELDGGEAVVTFGIFKTQLNVEKLILISGKPKPKIKK